MVSMEGTSRFFPDKRIILSCTRIAQILNVEPIALLNKINEFYTKEYSMNFNEAYASCTYLFDKTSRFNNINISVDGEIPSELRRLEYRSLSTNILFFECAFEVLERALRFLNLYNKTIEDRSNFFTKDIHLNYDKQFMPALIAFICLYKGYLFVSNNHLSYFDGIITLSFSSNEAPFISKYNIFEVVSNTIEYRLFKYIGLINQNDCINLFNSDSFAVAREVTGSFIEFIYISDKSNIKNLESKIIYYLMVNGSLRRKELAELCNVSDRTINYSLSNLLIKNKIETVNSTSKHSPNLKYVLRKINL